jgi:GNAT superfamily N-acetyltransferase
VPASTLFSGAELTRRRRESFVRFLELIASGHPDSSFASFADGGVIAVRTPASPLRSIFNSVAFHGPAAALVAALPGLHGHYEQAGVRAWTAWLHDPDEHVAAREALSAAGHRLDASPREMGAAIDDLSLAEETLPDGLTFDGCSWREIATVNEVAYGVMPGQFSAALAQVPADSAHHVVAVRNNEGDVVSTGAFLAHDGNAEATFIATLPRWRGHGLAGAVMARGLRSAREAGCETTTLEATRAGEPVYAALGYRSFKPVEMWERRW